MNHSTYANTSFSSSLLEEIYRSFDDDKDRESHSKRTTTTKTNRKSNGFYDERENKNGQFSSRDEIDRYVLEQWLDKEKEKEKVAKFRRNSLPEGGNSTTKFRRNSMPEVGSGFCRPVYSSSSTSSSDSSSGMGGFSSSDTDSLYGAPARLKPKATSLKPIRTAASSPEFCRKSYSGETPSNKSKKDGKFLNALKLYGELKKVKKPISPGGKFACFLNSLFHSSNSRKTKIEMTSSSPAVTSSSVPSTATSYSRSCLSKTPSSAGRFERRSVRFCPVNVVVDETGQRSVYSEDVPICEDDGELQLKISEKQKRVEEAAKELLKNYRSNNNNLIRKELIKVNVISANHGNIRDDSNNRKNNDISNYGIRGMFDEDEDEDEDDDDESCCSSDLFELDNLMEIGVDDMELPVYETTHIRTNRAIANGSI